MWIIPKEKMPLLSLYWQNSWQYNYFVQFSGVKPWWGKQMLFGGGGGEVTAKGQFEHWKILWSDSKPLKDHFIDNQQGGTCTQTLHLLIVLIERGGGSVN